MPRTISKLQVDFSFPAVLDIIGLRKFIEVEKLSDFRYVLSNFLSQCLT
jgi:hypothetical protein